MTHGPHGALPRGVGCAQRTLDFSAFSRELVRVARYAPRVQPLASTALESPLVALEQSAIGRAALAQHLPENARASMVRALSVLTFELARRCAQQPALADTHAALGSALGALDATLGALTDQPFRVDAASLEATLLAQRLLAPPGTEVERLGQAHGLLEALHALLPGQPAASPLPTLTEAALHHALAASRSLLIGLVRVVEAVGQLRDAADGLLVAVNVEAGHHALPDDVRELLAALSAAEASFHTGRYYAARFGERGIRFSRSDSCWLATMARSTPAEAHKHIRWLGRVLSNRGMPELLLEQHLHVLHDALCAALPEHTADYAVLRAVADSLAEAREASLPPEDARALCEQFVREVGPAHGPVAADEAARLLCAAIADVRSGAPRAVASLISFLGDPERFGERWGAAVTRLLNAADAMEP